MKRLLGYPVSLAVFGLVSAQSTPVHRHRVVIELNVSGTNAFQSVLANAENLKKAFSPTGVDIDIVCLGPGIGMLLEKDNKVAKRIERVQGLGVKFDACGNTLHGMRLSPKQLFSFAHIVDSGVAEIVRREEDGWSYLKGAY